MAGGWTKQRIIAETIRRGRAMGLSDRTIAVVLAVFQVESGFNPSAVGDGGTSFGLRQLHQGGQLTVSPQRAMDPNYAIGEALRAFKGVTTGAGAAGIQRSADIPGQARKIDDLIPQFLKMVGAGGGGGAGASTVPVKLKQVLVHDAGSGTHLHVAGYSDKGKCKQGASRTAVESYLRSMGLQITSTTRSPSENAAAGGVSNSDHLSTKCETWAIDAVGAKMNEAADALRSGKVTTTGSSSSGGGGGVDNFGIPGVDIPGADKLGIPGVDLQAAIDSLGTKLESIARWFGRNLVLVVIVLSVIVTAGALGTLGMARALGIGGKDVAGAAKLATTKGIA